MCEGPSTHNPNGETVLESWSFIQDFRRGNRCSKKLSKHAFGSQKGKVEISVLAVVQNAAPLVRSTLRRDRRPSISKRARAGEAATVSPANT